MKNVPLLLLSFLSLTACTAAPLPSVLPSQSPFSQEQRNKQPSAIVYFETGQATLKEEGKDTLKEFLDTIENKQSIQIRIEGRSNERASNSYNIALGRKRASVVAKFLITVGLKITQIKTISFGEEKPLTKGGTKAELAKNQDSVIVIVTAK